LQIFKRDDAIKNILSYLDIPRFLAYYEVVPSIGPYEKNFFYKHSIKRKSCEENAKLALYNLTNEELFEISEISGVIDNFAFEHLLFDPPPWYAAGFGVKSYKANFEYWAKMDFWTLEEATCLSIGFRPQSMPSPGKLKVSPYESLNFFWERLNMFKHIDFQNNNEPDKIHPKTFVKWLERKDIEMPDDLVVALGSNSVRDKPAMIKSVDARQYDSTLKIILGLLSIGYGYQGGAIENDIKNDIIENLEKIGLNIDRKTVNNRLNEARKSIDKFRVEQKKRDQ